MIQIYKKVFCDYNLNMKIAVDGSQLRSSYTGVGRYLFHLIQHLAPMDSGISYKIFLDTENSLKFENSNVEYSTISQGKMYFFWQNFSLLKALRQEDFDVFWSPNYYLPLLYKGNSIISVHDISWNFLKSDYSFFNRVRRNLFMNISLKKSLKIFTISNFSKNEIIDHYGVDKLMIRSIPLAVNSSFLRSGENEIKKFKKKFNLRSNRIIGFLGSIFKRRNVDKIIAAYRSLKRKYPDLELFIVGEIYDNTVKNMLTGSDIVWEKRLEEKEINSFYSSLELFIYISEYEGFGFPPLEALKCGTIPLLLNKTALKEIYKGMAIFIEKAGVENLADRIDKFFTDSEKEKQSILKEFISREDYFSWDRVAKDYLKEFYKIKEQLRKI